MNSLLVDRTWRYATSPLRTAQTMRPLGRRSSQPCPAMHSRQGEEPGSLQPLEALAALPRLEGTPRASPAKQLAERLRQLVAREPPTRLCDLAHQRDLVARERASTERMTPRVAHVPDLLATIR